MRPKKKSRGPELLNHGPRAMPAQSASLRRLHPMERKQAVNERNENTQMNRLLHAERDKALLAEAGHLLIHVVRKKSRHDEHTAWEQVWALRQTPSEKVKACPTLLNVMVCDQQVKR